MVFFVRKSYYFGADPTERICYCRRRVNDPNTGFYVFQKSWRFSDGSTHCLFLCRLFFPETYTWICKNNIYDQRHSLKKTIRMRTEEHSQNSRFVLRHLTRFRIAFDRKRRVTRQHQASATNSSRRLPRVSIIFQFTMVAVLALISVITEIAIISMVSSNFTFFTILVILVTIVSFATPGRIAVN